MSCSVVYWSEATSELPKVVRTPSVLYILTWKCASRHNGVHFSNIRTSKSGANMWCFVHFDLEMCFTPQRRALFQHPNLQKWREHVVFCTFWLGNVLHATTACTFSSLIWPAGSAPAALASLLFDPLEPQIIGKTQCFTTFLPFRASASSFFLLFFLLIFLSSLPLPCPAFHLSILSEVWLLNFLRWFYMYMYMRVCSVYIYIYICMISVRVFEWIFVCTECVYIYIYTHVVLDSYIIYIYIYVCRTYPCICR